MILQRIAEGHRLWTVPSIASGVFIETHLSNKGIQGKRCVMRTFSPFHEELTQYASNLPQKLKKPESFPKTKKGKTKDIQQLYSRSAVDIFQATGHV